MYLDLKLFAQCRTCCTPMIGILSVKAREDCLGCGGVALNVNNTNPSSQEQLARKYPPKKPLKPGEYRRL